MKDKKEVSKGKYYFRIVIEYFYERGKDCELKFKFDYLMCIRDIKESNFKMKK